MFQNRAFYVHSPGHSGTRLMIFIKTVHTATGIPLSAYGPGAWAFTGVMDNTGVLDNTDVFFRLAQAAVKGVVIPEGLAAGLRGAPARSKRKP